MGNSYSSNINVSLDDFKTNTFAQVVFNYAQLYDSKLQLKNPQDIKDEELHVLPYYEPNYYNLHSDIIDFYVTSTILSSEENYQYFMTYLDKILIKNKVKKFNKVQTNIVQEYIPSVQNQSEPKHYEPKKRNPTGNKINKKIKELTENINSVKNVETSSNISEKTAEGLYEQESI